MTVRGYSGRERKVGNKNLWEEKRGDEKSKRERERKGKKKRKREEIMNHSLKKKLPHPLQ